MGQIIYQADAFTDTPFAGNPAAVCLLAEPAGEQWMQDVASEMNLSENRLPRAARRRFRPALVHSDRRAGALRPRHSRQRPRAVGDGRGALRRDYPLSNQERALSRRGATAIGSSSTFRPATPVSPCDPPPTLVDALGACPTFVGKSKFDFFVEVPSEREVREACPDLGALAKLDARGVIVTAPADSPDFDFVSRFFAPASGIDEDPVTGSAHCALGPYWQHRLGKAEFAARQVSARGGELRVRVDGDRVRIAGQAVTVMRATLVQAERAP